ncbi:MAG: imelysin family protein [Pseudomonadota bacterium]
MKRTLFVAALASATAMAGATSANAEVKGEAVIDHYANIAEAKYADSLSAAVELQSAINAFLDAPSADTLQGAKDAWLASRVPYQQTEVYRFGNAIVDDWEGRVNAWPLDEGLIDYVDADFYGAESDENVLFTANVVANASLNVNGEAVDASAITPELISTTLHEAGGIEANVASGYHAIEFLLWGQDLNVNGAGAGERPYTDFSLSDCTNGNCDRRREYLSAATDLLIADLEEMAANWKAGGAARAELEAKGIEGGLATILTGMGSLSYGELAGERMKLGLLLGDPEEEHDCFADNTHNSHFYDAVGIRNVYQGTYTRTDGTEITGPSLADLIKAKDAGLDIELQAKLDATIVAMQAMVDRAEAGEAYDQMIAVGNDAGNAVVQAAIDGLVDQTRSIERAIAALELGTIELEGSESLDNPNAVFQ